MARPLVSMVGSVDESRALDPPLVNPGEARRACEELGARLAESSWDVAVYSADPTYIEADVVRGYVASGKAVPGSVHVHAPLGKGTFAESKDHPELFNLRPDASGDWEVAFFRSLFACDAVIVLGGGRSTLITGVIALARRVPLVAVAAFGGNGLNVWQKLSGHPGFTEADVAEMGRPWASGSAARLVEILESQRKDRMAQAADMARRQHDEARRAQTSLAVAVALLACAVVGLVVAWAWSTGSAVSIALLALVPTLAAAGGALIRTSLDIGRDWVRAGVLGAAAGLVTGLLYVASQMVGAPDVLSTGGTEAVGRLLFFVLPIGFVAGLTFDAVYAKLRGTDVSQAATIEKL